MPKKKSKKQLEDELQKAAEEQKRHEEKERLHKLEETALSKHQARLAAELDSKERVLEAERLEEESSIVTRMKGERRQSLEYEQSKLQDQVNWQKFISCTSRPNVAFENEITTYMTMVREDKPNRTDDARQAMAAAMKKCTESEEIVGDLLELYCKAREDGDVTRQAWCTHYIHEIRELEIDQLDEATAYLLQHIEKQETNSHLQVNLQWGQEDSDIKVGFWGHLQSKGFRAKQIEHQQIHIGLDLPKSIALQSMGHCIGVRTLYTTYDSVHGKDPSQMSVGGMIRVDLLSIPPFSKRVKGWTIRQVPPPGQELNKLPYPNTEHSTQSAAIALQPCKIEYKVPSHVIVRKSPNVQWWDSQTEKWSPDGITETMWEPEMRKISFFSQRLAAFSIVQERHLDLPYTNWCLRPIEPLMVQLTVKAARFELNFIISEDGLRLKGVTKGPDLPELHGVMYNTMAGELGAESNMQQEIAERGTAALGPRVKSPATLLKELRDCGLNLMPEDGDAEFLEGYTPKNPETQARAYSDLSEIAAFYDIASSSHNKSLSKDRALLRVRENTLYEEFDPLDPDCDVDYQSILFFPDKACFVQSREAKRSEALCPEHVTHASLYLCYDRTPTKSDHHVEELQRLEVNCTNVRFVETVRQTMQLMRLLCFV